MEVEKCIEAACAAKMDSTAEQLTIQLHTTNMQILFSTCLGKFLELQFLFF